MIALGAIACAIAVASLGLAFAFGGATAALARPRGPWIDAIRVRRADARAGRHALDILRSTQAALRSGLPLPLAVRGALEDLDAEARAPFDRALRSFDLGSTLDDACRATSAATRDRRVAIALDAISLVAAEQLPAVRSAALIASVADRLAFEERLVEEVSARTSGARAQIVLLACVVPAIALYLALTLPGLAATLTTPLGARVLIPGALLFEAAGIVASRNIVRSLET